MVTVRAAQYGTKHSHAAGKIRAMIANASVDLAGVYEPDPVARAALASQEPYSALHLFATKEELLWRITPHLKLTMRAVGPPACCCSRSYHCFGYCHCCC